MSKKEQIEILKRQLQDLEREPEPEAEQTQDPRGAPSEPSSLGQRAEMPTVKERIKRPRTPLQVESMKKAHAIKMQRAAARRAQREKEDAEHKAFMQQKIVEKAIKIKRAQIKKVKEVEDVPDEEPIQRMKAPKEQAAPLSQGFQRGRMSPKPLEGGALPNPDFKGHSPLGYQAVKPKLTFF